MALTPPNDRSDHCEKPESGDETRKAVERRQLITYVGDRPSQGLCFDRDGPGKASWETDWETSITLYSIRGNRVCRYDDKAEECFNLYSKPEATLVVFHRWNPDASGIVESVPLPANGNLCLNPNTVPDIVSPHPSN